MSSTSTLFLCKMGLIVLHTVVGGVKEILCIKMSSSVPGIECIVNNNFTKSGSKWVSPG